MGGTDGRDDVVVGVGRGSVGRAQSEGPQL